MGSNLITSVVLLIAVIVKWFGVELPIDTGVQFFNSIVKLDIVGLITSGFALFNILKHIAKPSDGNYVGFLKSANFYIQLYSVIVLAVSSWVQLPEDAGAQITNAVFSKDWPSLITAIAAILARIVGSLTTPKPSPIIEINSASDIKI